MDQAAQQIVGALKEQEQRLLAIPLPTRIKRYTVIRSPFIDKDSQEHFEVRTHKRLIDIMETTSKTVDSLTELNLPAGVSIDIKI